MTLDHLTSIFELDLYTYKPILAFIYFPQFTSFKVEIIYIAYAWTKIFQEHRKPIIKLVSARKLNIKNLKRLKQKLARI